MKSAASLKVCETGQCVSWQCPTDYANTREVEHFPPKCICVVAVGFLWWDRNRVFINLAILRWNTWVGNPTKSSGSLLKLLGYYILGEESN